MAVRLDAYPGVRRRWDPEESAERFRRRLEPVWEPDDTPRNACRVFFQGAFAQFADVLGCVRDMRLDVGGLAFGGPGRDSWVDVTCTHEQLESLKLAVKGCSVTRTRIRRL